VSGNTSRATVSGEAAAAGVSASDAKSAQRAASSGPRLASETESTPKGRALRVWAPRGSARRLGAARRLPVNVSAMSRTTHQDDADPGANSRRGGRHGEYLKKRDGVLWRARRARGKDSQAANAAVLAGASHSARNSSSSIVSVREAPAISSAVVRFPTRTRSTWNPSLASRWTASCSSR